MERVEWLVVFEDGEHRLNRFLEPGYGHCWAARPQGDCWIMVNPAHSHTQVVAVDDLELARHIGDSVTIDYINDVSGYRAPSLFSCVEVVKGLLGISAPWIITPYQLFRWIDEKTKEGSEDFRRKELGAPPG